MEPDHKHLEGIPIALASPVDLGRVMRELEALDNALLEFYLRNPKQEPSMPKVSHHLDQLLSMNRLNLLVDEDRVTLKKFLATIHQRAPRLHVSFSADPSPIFVEKLMTWLRAELHPVLLLTVGLQPNIGAGCIVRTTNKYFDLSLGKDFARKKDLLMAKIREINKPEEAPAATTAAPVPATPAEAAV